MRPLQPSPDLLLLHTRRLPQTCLTDRFVRFLAVGMFDYYLIRSGLSHGQTPWTPAALKGWLVFWTVPDGYSFTFEYLLAWGGRCGSQPLL